jgi:GAF domain-containing protein/HAMP domain-containing protein
MNKSALTSTVMGRFLAGTGNYFLIIVVAIAQLSTNLFALPTAYFIQVNAGLSVKQYNGALFLTILTILTGNILLLLWVHLSSSNARKRLVTYIKGEPLSIGDEDEIQGWKQITSLPWRYSSLAVIVSIFIDILPLLSYLRFALGATLNQLFFTAAGGIVSAAIMIALAVLIMDRMLAPARFILIPVEFERQLSGSAGARMLTKFQVIIVLIVLTSVLLIVPVGYRQTLDALSGNIYLYGGQNTIFLRFAIAGAISLVLGSGITFILSRSVSDPIRQMIAVFDKVEKGDLKQRAAVNATDEIGELSAHFNRMIARLDDLQGNLEKQVSQRTEQLKATIEVSGVASTILDPDELISNVVNLITDRFGYYYAAIFLVESTGQWAVLKDATGQAGQALKANKHRLAMGGKSMVSTAIATHHARIALDIGMEPVRFENPLLPNTRSEIALPLIVGERIIGALDVQSDKEGAFGEQDIDTLQGMANSVATALENARLFQETQKSLEELRMAQRSYVNKAWSETSRENEGYEYASSEAMPAGMELSSMDVPLTIREQIIGQLHLEGQQDWTPEERTLVEAVATQAALAMENARLLEESRQMALRERLAAEITGKIWSSPNTDFILQTVIKELGRALHADEATIELKLD